MNRPPLLLILPLVGLSLAGCIGAVENPEVVTAYAHESAEYEILYELPLESSGLGTLRVESNFTNGQVQQTIITNASNREFEVHSTLDAKTGELLQYSDRYGTYFPVGASRLVPNLGPAYYELPDLESTPLLAIHGARWALQAGATQWGSWVVRESNPEAARVTLETACDEDCANVPGKTWITQMQFDDGLLPVEIRLKASTQEGELVFLRNLHAGQGIVELAPTMPTPQGRQNPGEDGCRPLPCEGDSVPEVWRYADAFEALRTTLAWRDWEAGHQATWLAGLAISRGPVAYTFAGDVPVLRTTWTFKFYSPEGDEGYFQLQNLDGNPGPAQLAFSQVGPMDSEYQAAYHSPPSMTKAANAFATLLGPESPLQASAGAAPTQYRLSLFVHPEGFFPEPLQRAVWFAWDPDTNRSAGASAFDGRALVYYEETPVLTSIGE